MCINQESLEKLKYSKNLLAFSGGVDSSALFFLLLKKDIEFDIAIMNYNKRENSRLEIDYAKELSKRYSKKIYIKDVNLNSGNFEANAREARYNFFKELVENQKYQNIITAHQLNDKTEWFFMQFVKGAGIAQLFGMDYVTSEEKYSLVRPMLDISRDEIMEFLKKNRIKYFEDESNEDNKYTRNYFRNNITNQLVLKYKKGIKNSFDYLKKDADAIYKKSAIFKIKELIILKRTSHLQDIKEIDFYLKRMGYVLSSKQRDEVLNTKSCVVGAKIAIVYDDANIYISPFIKTIIPKQIREEYRKAKIPSKIRGYLFEMKIPTSSIHKH